MSRAAFGHNRAKKPGKAQIVIGLLTTAEGEPWPCTCMRATQSAKFREPLKRTVGPRTLWS